MNRFEQRLRKKLQNPEFAAGYQEMSAELELMEAIDEARRKHSRLLWGRNARR